MKRSGTAIIVVGIGALAGCDPAQDVEVLPLPPLEYATPEARLGLPEVQGTWHFAGWEVAPGDSLALSQPFPRFGELVIDTQRLDSVAGVLSLHGGRAPVVGEVRRDGWVALVTLSGPRPTGFLSARYMGDTLWVAMSSVVPTEDWPRAARAAFVRGPVGDQIAWLRGAVVGPTADPIPNDSLLASLPPVPQSSASPAEPSTAPATRMPPTPLGTPTRDEEAVPESPRPSPPSPRPTPQPAPSPPPAPPPAPRPDPESDPPIRLLGEPVTRDGAP